MTRDLCFFFFNVAFVEQRLGGKKKYRTKKGRAKWPYSLNLCTVFNLYLHICALNNPIISLQHLYATELWHYF